MTLMKVRLGRRRDRENLRPLTEKEIQKKLYGGYVEAPLPPESSEPLRVEFPPAFKKGKTRPALPSKIKKIRISIPWGKIVSAFAVGFKATFSATRILVSRIATGWGLGILVAALLFVGIHSLNNYRTAAMKAAKPRRPEMVQRVFKRKVRTPEKFPSPLQPATPEAKQPAKREEKVSSPVLPSPAAVNVVKEPPIALPPPETGKPYVIQVCTYANENDANKLVNQMKQAGLPAFAQSLARTNGKTFYLVFLGRFETFREAQVKLKAFRSEPLARDFPDSFVREL